LKCHNAIITGNTGYHQIFFHIQKVNFTECMVIILKRFVQPTWLANTVSQKPAISGSHE